ncbi:MAG: hypothetical protein GX106_04990 [Candidatus Cloacimonetes bacterium]|jgi:hypothetical protein|nr:hypothetical protein [Candidatus Cloacimonadota bacterium]
MLTIDWKERFTLDTEDYLKNKLPNGDYDFEIIFNAYPERVNGKVPSRVITYVSGVIVSRLGRKHADYLPFYRHLWFEKGENGKLAFAAILSKLIHKKPNVYFPLLEDTFEDSNSTQINALLDRVMLPHLRKHPDKYLDRVLLWTRSENEDLAWAATNLCLKFIKRREDLIDEVLHSLLNQWAYPLGELQSLHVMFLKTIAKLSKESYLAVWEEFGITRDPQIVELLAASVTDYHPTIEPIVESWTKSGNARVKKAGTAAYRIIKRKKGAKA